MVANKPRRGGGKAVAETIAEPIRRAAIEYIERHKQNEGRGGVARLAKAVHVSSSAVSQFIGGGGVDPKTAEAYARALGIDPPRPSGQYAAVNETRFRKLETVVAFYEDTPRWKPATIETARMGAVWADDVSPQEWVKRLDALERAHSELATGKRSTN